MIFGSKSIETKRLKSDQWGCLLDNDPKLAMEQPNSRQKNRIFLKFGIILNLCRKYFWKLLKITPDICVKKLIFPVIYFPTITWNLFYIKFLWWLLPLVLRIIISCSTLVKIKTHQTNSLIYNTKTNKKPLSRVFTKDFVSVEIKYLHFGGWSIPNNYFHEIPLDETHCKCCFIVVILTEMKLHLG